MRKIAKILLLAFCLSFFCSCGAQTGKEESFDLDFGSSENGNSIDLSGAELDFADQ